jgi:oxygen-independent coproporphyrinogen-3 oxidase
MRDALGRRAVADPADAVRLLRAAGVTDLSVDLIHGIPGQTREDLEADISTVGALRPEHVSWYELDVVEGTVLAERLRRAAAPESAVGPAAPAAGGGDGGSAAAASGVAVAGLPGDDERAAMYRRIVRALTAAGYRWYEVSSFALPGRRARHNVAYWRARPYLGLGAGAVATVGRHRTSTTRDVAAYVAAVSRGEAPPREVEELSEIDLARERLMLAARCGLRVPLAEVAPVLARDVLPALAGAGMISLHGGTIAVTRKGRYVANEVSVRLFRD